MPKIIKTVQWNIGGGKICNQDDNPQDTLAYCHDGFNVITEKLQSLKPDIITIQEGHMDEKGSQIEEIAELLGLKYFVEDPYADSHIEKGKRLSQAIISRFPILNHKFTLFLNPKFETLGPRGKHWLSHDKGVTSCVVQFNENVKINIKTSHSFPYRPFKVNPLSEATSALRLDMGEKLKPESEIYLYQGDLNYNGLEIKELLPNLMQDGVREALLNVPTTPKGRKYDRVLFKNLNYIKSQVITDVLTDHFPVYSEFEIL